MKAKKLKELIATLDDNDEVISPVDNEHFAGEFELYQLFVEKNAPGANPDDAPYTESQLDAEGAKHVWVLDATWTKVFNRDERKKRRK